MPAPFDNPGFVWVMTVTLLVFIGYIFDGIMGRRR
jgi:hypothetical protein